MSLKFKISQNTLHLSFNDDWTGVSCAQIIKKIFDLARRHHTEKFDFDLSGLKKWDSSFVALLALCLEQAGKKDMPLKFSNVPENILHLLDMANTSAAPHPSRTRNFNLIEALGSKTIGAIQSTYAGLVFLKNCLKSLGRAIADTAVMRRIDFLFALDDCGPKAIIIVSLISFMIGLILAFVGALQLKYFGAQIYIASLVCIGMTRIMGAIMTGIIMAGRTGASYAATIGSMQVNEELDALKTMGISRVDFLVLPRLLALMIAMPLLTMLADFMGIVGGAFVGIFLQDLPMAEYIKYTTEAFTVKNFLVGLFHGFVYAIVIALCGCYYGLTSDKNADGVGKATTNAVVSAIVWMIMMTGIITVIFERLGI